MNSKHLAKLEFPKVLDRLATYASFSAGEVLARALKPTSDHREVEWRLQIVTEARTLLDVKPSTTVGGARDVRSVAQNATRGAVLQVSDLLDVRDTLIAARMLYRSLTALAPQFPKLAVVARRIEQCPQVIVEINRCLDERGSVCDDASPELARIRREERIAHDRLQSKLQKIIQSPTTSTYLQEAIITQREGRYVIPLKADFKGRMRGVVHDVSSSGATVFIEPLSVVDLNNDWRELLLAEEQEVIRILAALSDLVAHHAPEIDVTVAALAELDLIFAKAKYAEAIRAAAPEVVPFPKKGRGRKQQAEPQHATLHFVGARHPLLDPHTVVPIDVVLDAATHVLIITGPNTGGKTVSLKTVGLLTVMAQAGLHLPVDEGSLFTPFEAIYVDIGDEQSIEQSLSTFSAHLMNILSFIDRADARSLVVLDELGAGTDPAEGAALARALLEHFRASGATTFVATHYPELKAYAQLTPGVCNASVEFNADTLSPTYRLLIGLPGRSNAFAIAQRLGLPLDIIKVARAMVSRESLRAEDMLTDIHRLRLQEVQARDQANAARAEADKLRRSLNERLDAIEGERQEVLAQARVEAAESLETVQAEVRQLRRSLRVAAQPLEAVTAVEREIEALESQLEDQSELESLEPLPVLDMSAPPISVGDAVWVHPLNAKGQVLAINRAEAEVQVGPARTRVSLDALEWRGAPVVPAESVVPARYLNAAPSPGQQLDLRGARVDEALQQLDTYLDAAFRAHLPWVRVVHGKGTGALRRAVREFLADYPLVSGYETAANREGGEGVTIAKLV